MTPPPIRVGGFQAMSLCDWPGQIVATVFCQGCPWDCPYCHNPQLIPPRPETPATCPDWDAILDLLQDRRGLLDGVVFSGGEPTLQRGLPDAIGQVRRMGFRIGLHTAGPYPDRLARVLPLLDWVGFDIKSGKADYDRVTRVKGSGARAHASLRLLLASGVDHETRTTCDPALLDDAALARLRAELAGLGLDRHKMQPCRTTGTRPRDP